MLRSFCMSSLLRFGREENAVSPLSEPAVERWYGDPGPPPPTTPTPPTPTPPSPTTAFPEVDIDLVS